MGFNRCQPRLDTRPGAMAADWSILRSPSWVHSALTFSRPGIYLGLLLWGAWGLPARADFTQNRVTQVQLTVNGPSGTAEASRSDGFAVSGSGITVNQPLNVGATLNPDANFVAPSDGGAFTFSVNAYSRDTPTPISLDGSTLPAYSEVTLTPAGVRDSLDGSIAPNGQGSVTAGGSGTSAVLSQSYTFTVFDRAP